jgi:phosphoserine phosphatase RsbU/P
LKLASFIDAFNQYACASSTAERYSTLFFGTLEPATGLLTYVNAGHVQPLLLRSDSAIERLNEGGLPIGLLRAARYEEGRVALRPGDTLRCLSDGRRRGTIGRHDGFSFTGGVNGTRDNGSRQVIYLG